MGVVLLKDNTILKRSDRIKIREDNDGVYLVLDKDTSLFTVLNATAGLILSLIDGGKTIREIKETLVQRFDSVPRERIYSDVDRILREFVWAGYIASYAEYQREMSPT